jgi:hypothetical protein
MSYQEERRQTSSFEWIEEVWKNIMELDWTKIKEFLRSLGVEMEGSEADTTHNPSAEPRLTWLQKSHEHQAFYRIDFLETGPQLLVLLPTDQTPLKFHFYLVQWSEEHPLGDALSRLVKYQGSSGFERQREVAEWHLLHAMIEIMKALFWEGQETSQFPSEIMVQKIC